MGIENESNLRQSEHSFQIPHTTKIALCGPPVNVTGKPAKTLYSSLIADLLSKANLREGTQGVPRSTYCFRHTYATLRLQEGVDVYFLAEQMGTSVHMIESHYGHVNTIKHADRVLQGMAGWELPQLEPNDTKAKASKAAATHDQSKRGPRNKPH